MTGFDPRAGQIFLGNEFVTRKDLPLRDVVNPADLSTVGRTAQSAPATVAEALELAVGAQKDWAALDGKSRAAALHRLADAMEADTAGGAAELMTREMGKPFTESVGELMNVAPIFRYFAELARDDGGFLTAPTSPGALQYARWYPYGVTAHIVPYNFPIILMAFTVAASLAAGNAVIVKPAPATSLSTLAFMAHFRALPAGLVACLSGGVETAQALIAEERIGAVAFTGSVEAGRAVAAACGRLLKPCVIEAGGSDPLIVMDSVDPDVAAAAAVTGAFHLSGQICTSTERIFVHERLHDAFLEAMVRRTRALRIGPGLANVEIGPLVSEAARRKVMSLVEEAVAQGARVACGGRIPPAHPVGWFYEPTVLTEVSMDMALMRAELFGPVAPIVRVRDLEEALALANASPFGLGAAVFTERLAEAMTAIDRLEAGMVWVNNILGDNDALPFGGWKRSGLGRALSRLGLNAFRRSKMVMMDPEPRLQSWWYPYTAEFYAERGGRYEDGQSS
jgi:acyl-CoA reductase-like NAD-dependent aldehyde dehydrogenase